MPLADPDVRFGALRVLPRMDGKYIVIDERRAPGAQTVMVFRKLAEAARAAKTWYEQGHGKNE